MNKNTICLVTFLVCLISLSTNLSYALSPKPLQVNDYYSKLTPLKEHSKTSREIIKDLQKLHYRQQEINDKLSSKIFDSYLSALDPEKIFFLSRDIDEFRTYKFELDNAERRLHILEGLRIALDNIDDIIATIRASASTAEASANLQEKFKLSEIQAKAILDMRLQKLTGLEREKLEAEYTQLIATVAELRNILATRELRMEIIKEETLEIRTSMMIPAEQ